MQIMYPQKAKTQWLLRELIVEDYNESKNSLLTAKKFKVSHTTVLKRSKEWSLENKSSAPLIPHQKHSTEKLCILYFLYTKEELDLDLIFDELEKQWLHMPRSIMWYHLTKWNLPQERRDRWKRINQKF